jgi:quercetin dioxygenase-like cupin family protein
MESTHPLFDINRLISVKEKEQDIPFFEDLLAPELVFRRVSRKVVGKQEYLEQLAKTHYDENKACVEEVILLNDELAYAIVSVRAKGTRPDQTSFSGHYLNTRFFRKIKTGWWLYAWYNDDLETTPLPAGNPGTNKTRMGDKSSFKGTVFIETLHEQGLPNGQKWYQVFFTPGSKTHWHIHPEGQNLYITSGHACVGTFIQGVKKVNQYRAGDTVHIPKGILHWHGASPDSFMFHIAHNPYSLTGQTSYWFGEE